MRYTGIQPQYFPRLHYIARILYADIFMIRDDAQFVDKHRYPDGKVDKSYQAHTPIKQTFGRFLLAVPTKHEGLLPLAKTRVSYDHDWVDSHLKTLQFSYSKAPNFSRLFPEIEMILRREYPNLTELNLATTLWGVLHLLGKESVNPSDLSLEKVREALDGQKKFRLSDIRRASEFDLDTENLSANEKIVALCSFVGADEDYCGGTGAAAYMDEDIFAKNGIKINVQDWKCQPYPQRFEKEHGFIPNLSIIDLLMNATAPQAVKIIAG